MIKEMIKEMNRAMRNNEISFDCVENLLKQLQTLTGLDYCIVNKRVAYRENGNIYDAWVNA